LSTSAGQRSDVISIAQAAGVLGVKPATVYAYISRGQLSSSRLPHDRRSWLSRTEVEEFARRRGARPLAAPLPLDPIPLDTADATRRGTAVGWIAGDRLLLRGRDATELAVSVPYAEVAELLWTGALGRGSHRRGRARLGAGHRGRVHPAPRAVRQGPGREPAHASDRAGRTGAGRSCRGSPPWPPRGTPRAASCSG
jgi:citrate synthase